MWWDVFVYQLTTSKWMVCTYCWTQCAMWCRGNNQNGHCLRNIHQKTFLVFRCVCVYMRACMRVYVCVCICTSSYTKICMLIQFHVLLHSCVVGSLTQWQGVRSLSALIHQWISLTSMLAVLLMWFSEWWVEFNGSMLSSHTRHYFCRVQAVH